MAVPIRWLNKTIGCRVKDLHVRIIVLSSVTKAGYDGLYSILRGLCGLRLQTLVLLLEWITDVVMERVTLRFRHHFKTNDACRRFLLILILLKLRHFLRSCFRCACYGLLLKFWLAHCTSHVRICLLSKDVFTAFVIKLRISTHKRMLFARLHRTIVDRSSQHPSIGDGRK